MNRHTHKTLLASLTAEERAHLTRKTNIDGVRRLSLHGGLIIVLGALVAARVPLWWLLVLPLGVLLVFLFTLQHETIHRTAFKSRKANDIVAMGCGWLLLLPPNWFRYFHFEHHRHTQDPAKDPELMSGKPVTFIQYLLHISGIPVVMSLVKTLSKNAIGQGVEGFVPESARRSVVVESRLMLCSYAIVITVMAVAGLIGILFFVWWLPLLVGQPLLRLYLMAEHGRCPFVANMFANTRTVFTNRFVCLLAWNMPFHAEHHAYPAVPFHRLPDFHVLVLNQLQVTANGYSGFHLDTIRSHLGRSSE